MILRNETFAVIIALVLISGSSIVIASPIPVKAQAQNATATTNTTTTETNATIPVAPGGEFPTQLPVFPEAEQQPSVNKSESNDNATKVLGLLDDAQVKIDEARNIIRALQAQIQEDREQTPANETGEIIGSANDSAEEIIDIVEEDVTNDTEVVDDIGNTTEDITDAIEDSIDSNENATAEDIENITDEAIEAIDNATEITDNSTTEVAVTNAMVRLLTNLVGAQDFNENLGQQERDELKANLQDAVEELASDAANSLR